MPGTKSPTTVNRLANLMNSILPVTEMTINELETELELVELAHGIFSGTAPGEVVSFSDALLETKQKYADRIRDIKNEIFERQVLVKS